VLKKNCREDVAACVLSHCEMRAQNRKCHASFLDPSEARRRELFPYTSLSLSIFIVTKYNNL
jgi:hypothetical protein